MITARLKGLALASCLVALPSCAQEEELQASSQPAQEEELQASSQPAQEEELQVSSQPAQEERVVCLGGSITEIVYAVGRGDWVVGTDTSSSYPELVHDLPKVGYHRAFSAEGVMSLEPTLVLHTSESGPQTALDQLENLGVELYEVPKAQDEATAVESILTVGSLLGEDERAGEIVDKLKRDIARVRELRQETQGEPGVVFLYGRGGGTLMIGGRGTTAEYMIELAGCTNLAQDFEGYKPYSSEVFATLDPDFVLMMSHGLESVGGVSAILDTPGVKLTRVNTEDRIIHIEDLKLLGFGPRMGEGALELFEATRR